MSFQLIDSHCHLDDVRFDIDRQDVIERAARLGVEQFIVPATVEARWPALRLLAESSSYIHPAYGLHPMFMADHCSEHLIKLDQWLGQNQAIAVGECGLDFFQSNKDQEQQFELFRGQLQIAVNHDLPVIIHARKALDLVIRELRRSPVKSGVIHSFSGSLQQAQQLIDLGFKLGIAAIVGYERARRLRDVVTQVDIEALVIESDAPDQAGPQHKGERNEPGFIPDHLQVIAELRGLSVNQLSQQLNQNCVALFALD